MVNSAEQLLEKASNINTQLKQSSNCQLTPITDIAELCQLRDLYRIDWPRHCVGYYCIENFIRWLRIAPDMPNLQILTLNGDWRSEGLCLILVSYSVRHTFQASAHFATLILRPTKQDRYQLFVNSLNIDDNTQLNKAISLLDWSIGYKVSSLLQCHQPAVLSVIEAKHMKLDYNNETLMYRMPCAQARKLQVNCPTGYVLQKIKLDDAKIIDDLWLNKHPGSLFLIKRLITWNINIGIYKKETEELVAWCLRLQGGFLGALQVKSEYKRLHLGLNVAAAISLKIAETGEDVMALVYETNKPARGMFEKLGFKIVDKCYWLRPFPNIKDYKWPDNM